MKFTAIYVLLILCSFTVFPRNSFSQINSNDIRMKSLQKNIERIEARIVDAESKMLFGDSLIQYGDQMIKEADADFFRIAEEVKHMNRQYRLKRKKLYKVTKSTNRELAIQARNDLRKLDEKRRLAIREFSFEVREMKKKAMKGDSDIRRGQQMQSTAAKSLKSAEKALRDAQNRYDLAMSPMLN